MTCAVSIDAVEGVSSPAGDLTALRIAGSSDGCNRIELRIACLEPSVGGLEEVSFLVGVDADSGAWSSELDIARLPRCVRCGRPLTVTATCLTGSDTEPIVHPDCVPSQQSIALPCAGGACPGVRASTVVEAFCRADLTRPVAFDIRIDWPAGRPVRTALLPGDGTEYPARIDRSYRISHPYDASSPGIFRPRIRIVEPAGCADIELPPLTIPLCLPVLPACPHLESISGTLIGSEGGCRVLWIAEVEPSAPGTFEWRFDGGEPSPPNRSRTAVMSYPTSGRHWVEVRYTPDRADCPLTRFTGSIETAACEAGLPERAERTECMIGRLAMVVLLATAIALAAVATCLSPPQAFLIAAAVFLAAFVIAAVLWGLLCNPKPCHWFLLVTGQAMFAAGLMLANVIGCCATLGYIGAAVAVAGVLVVFAWAAACRFDTCVVFQELAFVSVGVLAQVFVALASFCGTPGFAEDPVSAAVWTALNLAGVAFIVLGFGCLLLNGAPSRLGENDRRPLNPVPGDPMFPGSKP